MKQKKGNQNTNATLQNKNHKKNAKRLEGEKDDEHGR